MENKLTWKLTDSSCLSKVYGRSLFVSLEVPLFILSSLVVAICVVLLFIPGLPLTHAFGLLYNNLAIDFDQSEKLSLVTSSSETGTNNSVGSNNETEKGMTGVSSMMQAPQDVIIKVESNPIIAVGIESQIKLLILDKATQKPIVGHML